MVRHIIRSMLLFASVSFLKQMHAMQQIIILDVLRTRCCSRTLPPDFVQENDATSDSASKCPYCSTAPLHIQLTNQTSVNRSVQVKQITNDLEEYFSTNQNN